MLKNISPAIIVAVTAVIIIGLLALTAVLTPESNPAYDAAVDFMNAAGSGDDGTALVLLSDGMREYVLENCPEGLASRCIDEYTPLAWGNLISAVFRRAIPDGPRAFDVQLVATYEEGQGFAGVCIYHRVEQTSGGQWRVTAWSGFISCDEPNAGLSDLRQPDAPNYAPSRPVDVLPESTPETTPEATPEPAP